MTITTSIAVPQCLYRFYDVAGRLLYIGITVDLGGRWSYHNRKRSWWHDVVRATVEHHPDRGTVLAAEEAAIKAEKPIHNVVHNRTRTTPHPDGFTPPAGVQMWEFMGHRSGYTRTVPLWLYWEIDGDPMTGDWLPDEIDAVELWNKWRRDYPPGDPFYGATAKRIWWFVDGPGILDAAPGQDLRGVEYPPLRDFLTDFTWPVSPNTGEPLQWTRLPVVDKLWRPGPLPSGTHTKGGFIQEATGWKPAPFQSYVDVAQLEQLARL